MKHTLSVRPELVEGLVNLLKKDLALKAYKFSNSQNHLYTFGRSTPFDKLRANGWGVKKSIALGLTLFFSSLSHSRPNEQKSPIIITQESIASYRDKGFKDFIKDRHTQFQTAQSISSIPIVGTIFNWGLAAIKGVDMEKAKRFFDRVADEGKAFYARMKNFETNEHNLKYLNAIFAHLTPEMISKKSTEDLSNAIESVKEKYFPDSEGMYTKSENNAYTYASNTFTDYALCNLLAAHIVNSSPRHTRGLQRRKHVS